MKPIFLNLFGRRLPPPPWNDPAPIRAELFGVERLEQHAQSLAIAQTVSAHPPSVLSLHRRLDENAEVLLTAYRASAAELAQGRPVVPAAEWLLDNYHLVEEQIREIRDDLPPGYYRQLPKLASGPLAGYPRVFGLAWAFIAHTDSHFDAHILCRFLTAYQRVQLLTIGELWAVAITLRIVLIENLRRLADQITAGHIQRTDADALAEKLLTPGCSKSALDADIATRSPEPLGEHFAAQLIKRMHDQDPKTTPALEWLERRLHQQGTTADEVVQHALLRQSASNLTVRNIITSMRLISNMDWADLFESVSLVDECLRTGSNFGSMDFATRNIYRSAIEELARRSIYSELDIAEYVITQVQAQKKVRTTDPVALRAADPGYHLIAEGRRALEQHINFRPTFTLRLDRFHRGMGIGGYIGSILLIAIGLLTLALWPLASQGVNVVLIALLALAGFFPASEVATALVNRTITRSVGAVPLPALELKDGIPAAQRTLVVIPALLTGEADLLEQIERLEVHHLSGNGGDLSFALLIDGLDADGENIAEDTRLLAVAAAAIDELNRRYGPAPCGNRFWLLHRRRVFNIRENKWMGWERKRGKLCELNALLRGATDTSFTQLNGRMPEYPKEVRYVITLDADTRLPRDAAARLIGKMAHPLNQPIFDSAQQRIIGGYGILQPRVTPALPIGFEDSLYQRIFSGPGGMDPYAAAVSDVYQDLFGEGSFTGKGIYDIDAFIAALAGRVPDNTLLSHDLFEGIFARAGLASDTEVVEDFPTRYDVAVNRQHRWTRGDWQLLPWVLGMQRSGGALPLLGRLKMLDNLRRSLLAPATLLAFGLSWLLPASAAISATLVLLAALAIPIFLPSLFAVLPHRSGVRMRNHFSNLLNDLQTAAQQLLLALVFLADQSWRMGDAIARTLWRLCITRRHLLEWTTAAQINGSPRLTVKGFYQKMIGGCLLGLIVAVSAAIFSPASAPLALVFGALWLFAPVVAFWVSRPTKATQPQAIGDDDARLLRLTARRTWRFFETFVTPQENMLPPDNFQEDPKPVVAHRTSPTNMGLYLLSCVAARDFGWASISETVDRLESTLATMEKLARHKGHFFNWYDTQDLRVLDPPYVSSVDSGNLAGHLITLANACEEWVDSIGISGITTGNIQGIEDNLQLALEALAALPASADERKEHLGALLMEFEGRLLSNQPFTAILPKLQRVAETAVNLVDIPGDDKGLLDDVIFWIKALDKVVNDYDAERLLSVAALPRLKLRLQMIADTARKLAMAMDFAFLIDPERKLLSIGYSLADNHRDPSCYDLLASEARLASLFAIAKGDAGTRHWFHLGRAATPFGAGSALISWSGSMFEYLMPSLVMRAPCGSLLEQTNNLIVKRQQAYGAALNVPWGISESAYNARDLEFTYQYSNFGVPGLGLKRGLSENIVIAPYATGLATMVDAGAAARNYARLKNMGALGRYGFFEALDFTRTRVPTNASFAIIHNFMAHHQGMTIVAIANTLLQGQMRNRFHREPIVQACELLLQERVPRNVAIAHPRAEEIKTSANLSNYASPTVRYLSGTATRTRPVTHLLSNGRYGVMITTSGAGYSRWQDMAVTRWREDATRDDWGSFIYLRDIQSGNVWAASAQPPGSDVTHHANNIRVAFGEDHAEFVRREGNLSTAMDVVVASEEDGEVRRISLINSGRREREIEITSYAELVLTSMAADNAHPVFAKMFIQTEFLEEYGALIATRRPRSAGESGVWAAHIAVIEGESVSPLQYETDRAQFFGSTRHPGAAAGAGISTANALVSGTPLSNTVGTVLDPIFSLRVCVKVPRGGIARVAFWTLIAHTRSELLDLIDRHHDRNAYERAKTLAWTQAQIQLRHLEIAAAEAADFQRLAAPIIYADARFRAPPDAIRRGAGGQPGLWPYAISGDFPIVLLRIDDIEDIAQVNQLLRAHEYWRSKLLAVDLVIINERASSYIQDLQIAIDTAVRISQSRPRFGAAIAKGQIYALRADLMSTDARMLIQSVARVELVAHRGPLSRQLAYQLERPSRLATRQKPPLKSSQENAPQVSEPAQRSQSLEFFNGLGGFDKNGTEYVSILNAGKKTPAPWINVISNPGFGFQVSTEGSGYTWADNSRENQLTPWSNDPVKDPCGEAIYVRDEATGEFWTATAQPVRDGGTYVARHGHGYSRFEHLAHGIALDLLQYVPLADPIKISRLTLRNLSGKPRRLSVTAFNEWVLGINRGASGPYILTEIDSATGALLARNPWSTAFAGRIAFTDMRGEQRSWTADRSEFLGCDTSSRFPAALLSNAPLSQAVGAGLDPCAALQTTFDLAAGESMEIVVFLGQCRSVDEVRSLVERYRALDLDAVLDKVRAHWHSILSAVQVKTPDRAMDIMLNGWLLYQTLACRIQARSAFYQASGAYGFRDQLQDGMALTFIRPEITRSHLLRAASRQFVEGDVQHWWLPHSGQGVRTRISDDRVWLAFATATYITAAADPDILDEEVSFLSGPQLAPGDHDAFFQPMIAGETASLFEHCARGLDQCIQLTGEQGLPLIGTGDWNDGMNRVGENGAGESVWLGWLLIRALELFVPLAEERDPARARRWRAHAASVCRALEHNAWDGEWYRRATFDDGTWLGASDSDECRIDSIAQSWAVLSGAADPLRAEKAMASVEKYLIRNDEGLALLFTPPFNHTPHDPGYIKGYPPGLRENGGQYSHAAMWAIFAFTKLGQGHKAFNLFSLLNPINHARTPAEAARYKVEPYVVAADVYSVAPHSGRGGWTWYTGAAGWMYRAGIEGILGIRREGNFLVIDPCIPYNWPGFEAVVNLHKTRYEIYVKTSNESPLAEYRILLDDAPLLADDGGVRVALDGGQHRLVIEL